MAGLDPAIQPSVTLHSRVVILVSVRLGRIASGKLVWMAGSSPAMARWKDHRFDRGRGCCGHRQVGHAAADRPQGVPLSDLPTLSPPRRHPGESRDPVVADLCPGARSRKEVPPGLLDPGFRRDDEDGARRVADMTAAFVRRLGCRDDERLAWRLVAGMTTGWLVRPCCRDDGERTLSRMIGATRHPAVAIDSSDPQIY